MCIAAMSERTKKTEARYVGPYCVAAHLVDGGYVLSDVTGSFYPSSVHAKFLKPALVFDEIFDNFTEIMKIVQHHGLKRARFYKVRWKDSATPDSWVHESDLTAPKLVQDYWKANAVKHVSRRKGRK